MKKAAFIVIALTLLSKSVGFLRDIILSFTYGASNISDAYLIAYTIPGVIFSFIGTAIATSYIPVYSDIEKTNGSEAAQSFTNNMNSILFVVCTVLIALGWVFAYPMVKLFAMGFDSETIDLAIEFTKIAMLGIYISVVIHVLSGYLNIKNNFHIPILAGIPFNVIIILSIVASKKISTTLLPIGIITALIVQLAFMVVFVAKQNFKFKFRINWKDKNMSRLLYLSIPVFLGVSVNQINVLVDRSIASTIVEGGISALNYADRLNMFIQGIFAMSVATAMYPLISSMAAENNMNGLKKILREAIGGISLLMLPATIYLMVFAKQLIIFLYGRGAFDAQAITLTSSALFFYSLGTIGFGLREILARAFYSLQDTKTPMINAAIGMALNIVLIVILSRYMDISGIALSTSIAAIVTTVLLFISLRKKIGAFGIKKILASFLKMLFASAVMGVAVKVSFAWLATLIGSNTSLLVSAGIGAVCYFGIIFFMKIDEVQAVVRSVKRKFGRVN